MIVVTFLTSLTVVGAIVLAVAAIFDLIALIICKAGVKAACSLGITEAITKLITEWIYTGGVMIDTKADPSITNIEDAQLRLTSPERGLVAGNGVRFVVDLWTYVRHAAPEPGVVYHYPEFFTAADLRSTTVSYTLENVERKLKPELNQTSWADVIGYGWVEAEVPSPVVGWLVPTIKSKNLYQGARNDRLVSGLYPFNSAQINQVFPLYLNTGLALPRYDCWFQVCVHKAAKSSVSTDLGKQFILDILPATLDEFVNWSQLGPQVDRDGDGVLVNVDPNDATWDTDGDGLPDSVELKKGLNPRVADADADGLNDALELRYGTNAAAADTDGDGISDFDEIYGYMLTFNARNVLVTSDPTQRDSDMDGISDGAERRLNGIDPVRYPFHPRVFNEPPVRIYSQMADVDRVLAIGATTTVTTTVFNGTAVETALAASGHFSVTLPALLGGASQTRNFTLLPTVSSSIVLPATAGGATSSHVAINSRAAADLIPVGTAPSGPPDDIILDNPLPVTIDADPPNAPELTLGQFVQPGNTVIIGGVASDPTSYIDRVEVSVNGGPFALATGTSLWAFPVDIPNQPSGSVPIVVRATDAVGYTNSANFSLTIDSVSPNVTLDLSAGALRQVRRNAAGAWTLRLSGAVTDALAGVESLTFQVGTSANVVITPTGVLTTGIATDGSWLLDYPFSDPAFNLDPRPSGPITLTVKARDLALPDGNPTTQVIPFVIDMTPPTVKLLSHQSERLLTDGAVITGTVSDAYADVASVDYAFVDAATALTAGSAILNLPLNDLPGTVLFNNQGADTVRIYCLDESCPTSGENGEDGTAVRFDGVNDLLRTFEPLNLPESGLTTSLWFRTTCANCGLFSVTQGAYPAIAQHDRDLFLDAGKVCSSILIGGTNTREVRCTVADTYADGQWHQVVHSLGAGGNALYLDGKLAVSSPTSASTFSAQNGALVGYTAAAAAPFLNGWLDNVVIYDGALSAKAVAALYRQWRPATLTNGGSQWSFTVPAGIEGYYQIDMRAADSLGNRVESRGDWPQFRGPVDTKFPSFDVAASYRGSGSAAQTVYSANVRDYNLTTENYDFVCALANDQLRYNTDAQDLGLSSQPSSQLAAIVAQCTAAGFQTSLVAASACDTVGHCGAAVPPQTVAYLGTTNNRIQPTGSLPNAIERANLSDPGQRQRLIERAGKVILDIAVDESHGKFYWAEMLQGDYAQPAGVWRANLDGSGVQQVVSGLTAYGAEALQIALDPAGNKLYWTKGHELWWANLDGSLPQVVYSIPPDPRYIGGGLQLMQIGDVVVDQANGLLYFSERRQRGDLAGYNAGIRNFGRTDKHTLIVQTNLNGANPAFFAGAGPSCTYANFYENLGSGVGPGADPTFCLTSGTDGFDVEALALSNGTLYWGAIDNNGVSAGVYGRTPGQPTFSVAPLDMPGNSSGLRTTPLPQLHVDDASSGVFAMHDTDIVRGERGGEFTVFTSFVDNTPAAPGNTRRSSSTLSAMTVVKTSQDTQTDTDLAVGITSPALVIVNGQTARYDIALRNDAALAAADTVLTLTLPDGASFAGASRACVDGGATVTCSFGRFPALAQQSVAISMTVTTSTVRDLTATVSVASSTAERTPANNVASHSRITAAPTLAALPGIPYIYYGEATRLTRVPLFGSYTAEPLFMDPPISGEVLASDPARNKLFIVTAMDKLIAVNPDGSGRVELADTNQPGLNTSNRQRVAVDDATGRVYWSEIKTLYLTDIKSANPDGTGMQTVVSNVRNQRGLLVDSVRRKLLWVGADTWLRQDLIFSSGLDGSGVEVVYAAPEGAQIRELALNPYSQKLYWLDPTMDGGSLLWADSDGNRVATLATGLGSVARGLIVRPFEDALYYVSGASLMRAQLDGSNEESLADLSQRAYTGLMLPVNAASFSPTYIVRPAGNLAFVIAAPFGAPPCVLNDSFEPNNSTAAARAITVGSATGALCTTDAALPQDIDYFKITVPDGKQLDLTLSNLPADYGLYVQRAGLTLATSLNPGLANETIALPNYDGDGEYTIVVFTSAPANNPAPYTLAVGLSDAPPSTNFTNAQCLSVDPLDAPGLAGNQTQANATPLTIGSPATGALCYQDDVDFYTFNAVAGQRLNLDLPVRPADYELHVYRPNGTFFNAYSAGGVWRYPAQVNIDASGAWAVAVRTPNLTPTMSTYELLITDGTCSANDSWEPNNTTAQAAALGAPGRVVATLCSANDVDAYSFSAVADQRLTINYPANAAGATLRLLGANETELGRVQPGTQGNFTLAAGGTYTLVAANNGLAGSDAPYMFQWLLDAPQTAPDQQYVYYSNGLLGQLFRVALSPDHTTEPLFLAPAQNTSGPTLAADAVRSLLYSYDPVIGGDGVIVRSNTLPFDGGGFATVVPAPNPDGVANPPVAIAVDEQSGRIYWVQPQGGSASLGSTIRSANGDGTDNVQVVGSGIARTSLVVDSVRGLLYWTEDGAIKRSQLDGADVTEIRATVGGQTPIDLALDPFAQRLYWLDTGRSAIVRANADASGETLVVTGLAGDARGVAVLPLQDALFYSSGGVMRRAALDGSNPVTIATLSGAYAGPSNLNPNTFPQVIIEPPQSPLTIGSGTPLISPCALADSYEPNNDIPGATPLTVASPTEVRGALCNSVLNQPADLDYYRVTVADRKTLSAALSELPANYRVIIQSPAGVTLAFSDNDGLADEFAEVSNTSGATVDFIVLVMGYGFQNTNQYKLTLALGDVPPPPDPDNDECGFVDVYDAPGVGNGTLATATDLTMNASMAAALCYASDVDMYAFNGLNGETLTFDLPIRPADYTLTLYNPNGDAWATPTYGGSVTLDASGRWTVAVSQPALTPTVQQYQLLVTDQNCVASDANEPNNSAAFATPLSNGSRVRATLCSATDVDLYTVSATAGQELTLNYPANASGAVARVAPVGGGGDLGQVAAGSQGVFTIPTSGDYHVVVENNALTGSAVPYQFELLLGSPTPPPSGSPYIYYSRTSDLIRAAVVTGTVEPLLLPDGFVGGPVIASDSVRGKLYILDNFERVVQVNPDGSGAQVVVADTGPGVLRFTESLAVDERSGRIYWAQATFGVVSDIKSANGDGSDVQTVVTGVASDHGLTVDPVGGRLYWAQTSLVNGAVVDHIRRSNLDGTGVEVVYAAPEGRQIRELTVDPFAQMLYWRDPTQSRLLRAAADGSGSAATVATVSSARGFVVRPLLGELYYTAGSQLWRAALDGSSPVALATLDGAYNGVSNLNPGAFYPTVITPPGSNLALAYGEPFAQPCSAVDGYEPNNTLATAAGITPGTLSAALCSPDLVTIDDYDYYQLTVADGKQITVTLTDLPQDYSLVLFADGVGVGWSYEPGTADEVLTHVNRTGAPVVYAIMVGRFPDFYDSRLPYSLHVAVADAPPPPPPPPPPADGCASVDPYDAPGVLGNQTRETATSISFNQTITAALCYNNDKDYYAFDGVVGQNVRIEMPVRPADYYISVFNPDGQYVTGIFPGSWLQYGDQFTLNTAGRWTLGVWHPNLTPTTDQYQLRLGVNTTCSGLDPYEPNNEEYNPRVILTRTLTLRAMLCETTDQDWFAFPMTVGDRIRITPRILTNGVNGSSQTVNMNVAISAPGGFGFGEIDGPFETIVRGSGDFVMGLYTQPRVSENLAYEVDVEIIPPPPPPPVPNNWTCTVYPSSDVPQPIDDLATMASTVNVPANGTVTRVSLRDITFDHGGLFDLTFGLAAPDGTQAQLFAFNDYGFYTWCGGSNCQLSLDDWAIEGLAPPQFPNDGGAFRPSRSSFAPFNGKPSNGVWTFYITDDGLSDPGGEGGPTTGDLFSWGLEVCVDNGLPPDPPPTPTPTPTPDPLPDDGAPPGATAPPVVIPTPTPPACTPTPDVFEDDDTYQTAVAFDTAVSSSAGHNFDSPSDADWQQITLLAGLQYTLTATTANPAQAVSLALYQPNGTTFIKTQAGQLTYEPAATGSYYVRATSASGLAVNLCQSGYSLVLTRRNPNAPPVPPPSGPPLPPGHTAPPRSAGVLAPADGAVKTQLQPMAIEIGLNAEDTVQSAALLVNGVQVASYPTLRASPRGDSLQKRQDDYDLLWTPEWTPLQAGAYDLTVVITDSANLTATSPVNTIYVDLADPSVSIAAETITMAKLRSDGAYVLNGTAADDSQVDKVEVRLDGGAWQEAVLDGSSWSLALAPLAQANPDGGMLTIEARATDKASRTASDTANVLLDVIPPAIFTSTTSLTSGAIISPSQVINDLSARLAWPAISGASSVYAGWTTAPTASLGALTFYNSPAAGSHDQTMPEASVMFAHVVAVDANGNQRANSSGPYYFDGPQTPDRIVDLALENWVNSGGKQVGQMATETRGVQKLYAGWDATRLRLRWQGFDARSEGDLYLYLGTGGGGTTDLYNPYGPGQSGVLPFAANYVVRVSGGITPTLLSFSGGTWTVQAEVAAQTSAELTDVLLPFSALGIANPAAASLKLLGVASEAGDLVVWATVPDRNLGRPWAQYVQFDSLGPGIVPAAGVWADAQLEVTIVADPPPSRPVGSGDAISVTVSAQNVGSAPLPSLTINGATTGGVSLSNAPQVASSLAPSATVSLTLLGAVTADGTLAVTLADSYHRPYQLETLAYAVDAAPPINVSVAISYVMPYTNTMTGFAQDDSALSLYELEINNGTRTHTVFCDVSGSLQGGVVCTWNAGNAADGAAFTLRARAADVHGNTSSWSDPIPVLVDAAPPQLTLSAATLAALSDGRLNAMELALSGALTDNRAADRAWLCTDHPNTPCTAQRVLPDGSWTLTAPSLGDSVTTTLAFTGYDLAGNASQTVSQTVVIDTVAPQFGVTTLSQGVVTATTPSLLGYGTVTDGGGVAGVQIFIVRPDGSTAMAPATLSRAAGAAALSSTSWSAQFVFDQTGDYQVLVVATDVAGNQGAQFAGLMNVGSPLAAPLADFSAAQQGEAILVTWETVNELGNVGFNLYRGPSAAGPDRQLNQTLIPSQSPGSSSGFIYTWEDRVNLVPGMTYFYWVDSVDGSGATRRYGPVSAYYTVPTAVRLSAIETSTAAGRSAMLLGLLLVVLAGALAWRRRDGITKARR